MKAQFFALSFLFAFVGAAFAAPTAVTDVANKVGQCIWRIDHKYELNQTYLLQ
ncbi:hypothetical protein K474DRAFT_1669906 [Panus rudis PR-1116 ss-1]|nr:hypothetical protein K474DRAFT_1669906 [Panus rudis PR-1116 ss-1]